MAALHARHRAEVAEFVRAALERNGWSLTATAREIGVTIPRLQRFVEAHGLAKEYARRAPGPGRPKKKGA
jgi:hypothetical protein